MVRKIPESVYQTPEYIYCFKNNDLIGVKTYLKIMFCLYSKHQTSRIFKQLFYSDKESY